MNLRLLGLGAMGWCLLFVSHAHAVIVHPVDDATVIPGPAADVVGRWNSNGSAVAIDPNYIITVGHPGGGVGSSVVFNNVTYQVAQIFNNPTADLRIARIETLSSQPANLTDYIPVYTTAIDPNTNPTNFTLMGFGKGRGTALTNAGGTYGYNWLSEGNTNERSGRNVIEAAGTAVDTTFGYTSQVYAADFDRPGVGGAIAGEAIIAEFDSGGGWFIEDGPGNWKLAALSRGVGHEPANMSQPATQALFASHTDATDDEPDIFDGVNLSAYASFINSVVPEPGSATLVGISGLLFAGRRRRTHD